MIIQARKSRNTKSEWPSDAYLYDNNIINKVTILYAGICTARRRKERKGKKEGPQASARGVALGRVPR